MEKNRLEPIEPKKAVELYLEERKEDASYDTRDTIQRGITPFEEWCDTEDLTNLNALNGRQLITYKKWCKENTENGTVSLNGILGILRRFLVFCVQIDAVTPETPDKVPIPNVPNDEDVCYDKPSDEQVERITDYLKTYEPASRRHVEFAILKEIGNRVGSLRGIDVCDVNLANNVIKFKHRPEKDHPDTKGTPLKNGTDGERQVNISNKLSGLINKYLNSPDRHDVIDKFGREPLLTSKYGRPSVETIRRDLYKLTRPCTFGDVCPHGREINSCEATRSNHASKCPSSHSPHPIRRWSIEHQIDRGVPKDQLTDRVDVSVPVLNKHYDLRSEERKRKQRLKTYEKLYVEYGDADATLNETEINAITNDNGMIDPVSLMELVTADNRDVADSIDEPHGEDIPEPKLTDEQSNIADFANTSHVVWHPAVIPVLGGIAVGKWLPRRVSKELESLTPETENPQWPSRKRATKGAAAYGLYVCLIALNLSLLGAIPA